MKKVLISSVLAATTTLGLFAGFSYAKGKDLFISPAPVVTPVIAPAPVVLPFEDVQSGDMFFDAINYVYQNKIMNGMEITQFAPQEKLTRAMFVTMLYRSAGEPAFMNDLVFNDVVRDSYYEKAVIWAQGKGIVNGVSETEFAPNASVPREQMAAMLYRYAKYMNLDIEKATENTNTLSYDDIMDISEYASPAVHACLANGALLDNREANKILPKEEATRAEAANAIMEIRELTIKEEEKEVTPNYEELVGNYMDKVSQRARLEVAYDEENNKALLTVEWANSAFEYVQWTMSAEFNEENQLAYNDCTKKIVSYNESGDAAEKVEYENGTGYFTAPDGNILWVGAEETDCQECFFEKM